MLKFSSVLFPIVLAVFIQACGPKAKSSTAESQNAYSPLSQLSSGTFPLDPPVPNSNRVAFTLPQLDLGKVPTIHLRNVHVVVIPNNLSMKPEGPGIQFQSTDNTIKMNIDSITIDEIIEKDFGGVVVNIVTQAQCNLVSLNVHDAHSMLSGVLLKNAAGDSRVEKPVVQVGAPEFQMTKDNCLGAQGFDQLIESTIRKDLQDHELMSQLISEELIPLMSKWGNSDKVNP